MVYVIRDTDLQVINLYRKKLGNKVYVAVNQKSSSVIFGRRLVQDAQSYS